MQDFHLQGLAYWGLPQLSRIPVTIHISAAKPLSGPPPVRSICSPVGERSDANPPPLCPIHPDTPPPLTRSPSPLKRGGLQSIKGGASRFVRRHLPLGRSPFPLRHIAEGVTPRPQGVPPSSATSLLTAVSFQLTGNQPLRSIHHPAAKPPFHLMPPVRNTHNPVGPAKRCPTCHPYALYIGLAGAPKT